MDFEIAVYVQASTEAEDVPEKLKDHDTAIAVVRCSDAPANHNRSRIECPDRAVPSGPSATTRPGGHHDHPLNEQANQATPPRHVGGSQASRMVWSAGIAASARPLSSLASLFLLASSASSTTDLACANCSRLSRPDA